MVEVPKVEIVELIREVPVQEVQQRDKRVEHPQLQFVTKEVAVTLWPWLSSLLFLLCEARGP